MIFWILFGFFEGRGGGVGGGGGGIIDIRGLLALQFFGVRHYKGRRTAAAMSRHYLFSDT